MSRLTNQQGMTLVEASVVIATVAVLSAIMAPAVNGYIEQARQARTREDVKTIAEAIQQFVTDTGEHQFLVNGQGASAQEPPDRTDGQRIDLLVSDGDIPSLGSGVSTETYWQKTINDATTDTLSNHLVENDPKDASGTQRWRNPSDISLGGVGNQNIDFARTESSGFNAPHAWRGPYLTGPVDPDPWGNRYAVNVGFLDVSAGTPISGITSGFGPATYPRLDVFVLSAGADEEIDTPSAQDGAVPGDDDFIYIVSGNAK